MSFDDTNHSQKEVHQTQSEIDAIYSDVLKPFTSDLEKEMQPIYDKVKHAISPLEWPLLAPKINAILALKKKRNAVILAHNYQNPEIFHGIADITGDSLSIAREATQTQADVIVQCGVYFMAETSKILNPQKMVLIPDERAGCSLASSITAADVRSLRSLYPGRPVVTYVNTSAEVKAESDICCTSSNALAVVESLNAPEVIFIPDAFLARNVASQTSVKIIAWHGVCEVHERFTVRDIERYKSMYADVKIIAHPECAPDIVDLADFSGSTSAMANWVKDNKPKRAFLVTECAMSDNIVQSSPDTQFIRPCYLCPHMQRITLDGVLRSLVELRDEVYVSPDLCARARASIERMLSVS